MGARLSQPRGPAGTTESSHPSPAPPPPTPSNPSLPGTTRRRPFNARTAMAPAAAFTMACILFVYSTTSIRAAKENARRYRERDTGGEGLSLLEENRRRHGVGKRREGETGVVGELGRELFGRNGEDGGEKEMGEGGAKKGRSEEEERLRALKGGGGESAFKFIGLSCSSIHFIRAILVFRGVLCAFECSGFWELDLDTRTAGLMTPMLDWTEKFDYAATKRSPSLSTLGRTGLDWLKLYAYFQRETLVWNYSSGF